MGWTSPNPGIEPELRLVRRDARNREGNEHLIALRGVPLSVNPVPSCAELRPGQRQSAARKPATNSFSALGGIRTPNLLIRRRVRVVTEVARS
jgi:hypothetical protein